ncbi:MAG: hypothetical protein LBB12_01085 [Holosporaceae bacterium]|jgi:hypothetical protein|nr:hypothetical protein [Holosporaceae bacterium]
MIYKIFPLCCRTLFLVACITCSASSFASTEIENTGCSPNAIDESKTITNPETVSETAITNQETVSETAITNPETADETAITNPETADEPAITNPETAGETAITNPEAVSETEAAGETAMDESKTIINSETMSETEAEDLVKNVFAQYPALLNKFIIENRMATRSRLKKDMENVSNDSVIEKIEPFVKELNNATTEERREKIFELLEKIVTESYHLLVKDFKLNEYNALRLLKKIVWAIEPTNYSVIDGVLYITSSRKKLDDQIAQTDDDFVFADEKNRNMMLAIFHKIIVDEKSKASKQATVKPEVTAAP